VDAVTWPAPDPKSWVYRSFGDERYIHRNRGDGGEIINFYLWGSHLYPLGVANRSHAARCYPSLGDQVVAAIKRNRGRL
jgi:hypothetical protein